MHNAADDVTLINLIVYYVRSNLIVPICRITKTRYAIELYTYVIVILICNP